MTKSIYDQLNAHGTVAKQRFVDTFSGSSHDDDRWFFQDIAAGASAVMADTVDGGLQMTTDAGSSPSGYLGFNNICQYNPSGFRFISTCKKNGDGTAGAGSDYIGVRGGIGSADNPATIPHMAVMSTGSFVSSTALTTNNGGSYVDTYASTPVAKSTTEFMYDIVGTPSNITMTLDGVTEITKTTALPTLKCQPVLYIQSRNTNAIKTWNCKYMECYNT
jgi:hypothetical protein